MCGGVRASVGAGGRAGVGGGVSGKGRGFGIGWLEEWKVGWREGMVAERRGGGLARLCWGVCVGRGGSGKLGVGSENCMGNIIVGGSTAARQSISGTESVRGILTRVTEWIGT